jgi:hypothetical protein
VPDEIVDESESDDGVGLYLFWRFVAWRARRGLPAVDLDDLARVREIVAELNELLEGARVTRVQRA